jgi:hypothetical protein
VDFGAGVTPVQDRANEDPHAVRCFTDWNTALLDCENYEVIDLCERQDGKSVEREGESDEC